MPKEQSLSPFVWVLSNLFHQRMDSKNDKLNSEISSLVKENERLVGLLHGKTNNKKPALHLADFSQKHHQIFYKITRALSLACKYANAGTSDTDLAFEKSILSGFGLSWILHTRNEVHE